MERITTGDEELDAVLGGGLPTGTFVVVAGPPGSGKSVLANQIAFSNATADAPAHVYSTMSESPSKVRRHLADFAFFEPDRFGSEVVLLQLAEFAERAHENGEALADVADEIMRRTFATNPAVVVVDSSRVLEAYGTAAELRTATFMLASKMAHSGAVMIYVGEYRAEDLEAPEFAVADVILMLANEPAPTRDRRTIRVAKLRGSSFVGGQHPFVITNDGFQVHRRLESVAPVPAGVTPGRAPFRSPQVNAMTGGGVPRGEIAAVLGPTGTGKTTLSMHWLRAALDRGESALYVALEETPAELTEKADGFGLDFSGAVRDGHLAIEHAPAGLLDLDRLGFSVRAALARQRPDVVVVDAVSSLLPTLRHEGRSPAYEAALTGLFKSARATTLLTYEIRSLGVANAGSDGFSNLANTLLMLRYMERGSELGHVLSVLKMRRSEHDKGLLQFQITRNGFEALGEAADASQITGWTVLGGSTMA